MSHHHHDASAYLFTKHLWINDSTHIRSMPPNSPCSGLKCNSIYSSLASSGPLFPHHRRAGPHRRTWWRQVLWWLSPMLPDHLPKTVYGTVQPKAHLTITCRRTMYICSMPGEGQMLCNSNDHEKNTGCRRHPCSHPNVSSACPKAQHVANSTVSLVCGSRQYTLAYFSSSEFRTKPRSEDRCES
ncbi:hypothetical protein SCLCIDRAFT_688988 [Scleroderma citrinum Foug A]|uniref:Uncharacterized protein n=1 Tax=Scleroderma citrinum Foug A TaxID=1036808 RepID=A0A0C3DT13_9AGAM|nr:hypothetical protein SCLCIDRAFT_688988 [Scleroderma citrinum Foug A]